MTATNGFDPPVGNGVHPTLSSTYSTHTQANETQSPALSGGSTATGTTDKLDARPEESRILDLITDLQQLKIEAHYEMPQIIVCGSQSAGKSSVLEAVTGIPFPRDTEVCTKFVTRITLNKSEKPLDTVDVRIQPADSPDRARIKNLRDFRKTAQGSDCLIQLSSFLQDAKEVIFEGFEDRLIARDTVLVTITGPKKRPLQVIDLPGLMGTGTGRNEVEDVKAITRGCMKMPQSIILAVVRAIDDVNGAQSEVLDWAKSTFDPDGKRTIGVVTHPDRAGNREEKWIRTLQGEETVFNFKNIWFVVRNPDQMDRVLPEDRDYWESEWFQESPWRVVPEERRGSLALYDYLCHLLVQKLNERLPKLHAHLSRKLITIDSDLSQLGGATAQERTRVFHERMKLFSKAARDHARGHYESDISPAFKAGEGAYLRSRVVEEGERLRDNIHKYGHAWDTHIAPEPLGSDTDLKSLASLKDVPQEWSKRSRCYENEDQEIKAVTEELKQRRGQDLPGHTNPARIQDYFWELSQPWYMISKKHVEDIIEYCRQYLVMMAAEYFKPIQRVEGISGFPNATAVAAKYIQNHVQGRLEARRHDALKELERLEDDRKGPLINYEMSFLREQRTFNSDEDFRSTMKGSRVLDKKDAFQAESPESLEPRRFAQATGRWSQEEQFNLAARRFVHDARQHYLIVRGQFISSVMTQVVERHILREFEEVFPQNLTDEKIEHLTVEDQQTEKKQRSLENDKEEVRTLLSRMEEYERMG